jgi:hypothetical protein
MNIPRVSSMDGYNPYMSEEYSSGIWGTYIMYVHLHLCSNVDTSKARIL